MEILAIINSPIFWVIVAAASEEAPSTPAGVAEAEWLARRRSAADAQ